ncbi:MAG: hypothetical protein JW751_28720 [Polyangiaceae bacterium]|nr:hypothetical protein [Polyangiaceae bacterium]
MNRPRPGAWVRALASCAFATAALGGGCGGRTLGLYDYADDDTGGYAGTGGFGARTGGYAGRTGGYSGVLTGGVAGYSGGYAGILIGGSYPVGGYAGYPLGGYAGRTGGYAGVVTGGVAGYPTGGSAGRTGGYAGVITGGYAGYPLGGVAGYPAGGYAGVITGGVAGVITGGVAGVITGGVAGVITGGVAGSPSGGNGGTGGDYCGSLVCGENAYCEVVEDRRGCFCYEGYRGDPWDYCEDIDECAEGFAECDPDATCYNTDGSYDCECEPPYWGDGFACEPICPGYDLGTQVPIAVSGASAGFGDFYTAGACGAIVGSRDYTVAFTAPLTGSYTFSLEGSEFDTVLAVLDGRCSTGRLLGCNDDTIGYDSLLTVPLVRYQEVTAVVDGYVGSMGFFVLSVTRDDCPSVDIGTSVPITLRDDTNGYPSFYPLSCGAASLAPQYTVRFTPPSTRTYTIDTVGSSYDTVLAVLSGDCAGSQMVCNDDSYGIGSRTDSQVVVNLTAYQPVTIIVSGYSGYAGSFALNIA